MGDQVVEVARSLILGGLETQSLLPHGSWEVIICYLVPLKPSQCPALSRYSMTLSKVGLKREISWTLFIFKVKPLSYQYHEPNIRATIVGKCFALCIMEPCRVTDFK